MVMLQTHGIIPLIIMKTMLVPHILKAKEMRIKEVSIVVRVTDAAVAVVAVAVHPAVVVAVQTNETEIRDSMAHNR